MPEKDNENKKSGKKILIRVITAIIIIALVILVIAKMFIDNKINKISYEELNLTEDELGISEQQKDSQFRNIAILGTDSRYNSYDDFARTDCIMIASINKENNDISLFSIYRDTLAEMDLYNTTRLDKINHSYYGGVETTIKTINTNYDLNVEEYILVNFEAVAELVDKAGGIELDITADELKYINGYIAKKEYKMNSTGKQQVNGAQAVAYSRIRYTEGGDFKRTDRMRTVLEKTFQKLKNLNLMELNSITDVLLSMIKTNIPKEEINQLLPKAMSFNIVNKFGFPYNAISTVLDLEDYYEGTKKGPDYYDVPLSLTADVEKLHRDVLKEENYTVPEKIKEIESKIKETTNIN